MRLFALWFLVFIFLISLISLSLSLCSCEFMSPFSQHFLSGYKVQTLDYVLLYINVQFFNLQILTSSKQIDVHVNYHDVFIETISISRAVNFFFLLLWMFCEDWKFGKFMWTWRRWKFHVLTSPLVKTYTLKMLKVNITFRENENFETFES